MPAFPAEAIPLLSEGLFLFIPTTPSQTLQGFMLCEAPAYLFIWTPASTFLKPTRNSPYCSLYRYLLELASDVLHIFDADTLGKFEAGTRPFGRSQRKQFASYKLVGKTEQETDIKFDASEPVPLGMDLKHFGNPDAKLLQVQAVKSNCCILAIQPCPPKQKQKADKMSLHHTELKQQLLALARDYSLTFAR